MNDIEQTYEQSVQKMEDIKIGFIKKIYFMGIKGVGMTALALIAQQAGFLVRGCDIDQEFITDAALQKAEINVDAGFDPDKLLAFVGDSPVDRVLLIITGAHGGFANPISRFAAEKGIQVVTQGQAVGLLMAGEIFGDSNQTGVSVAGSHGKTTITAMLATMLTEVGRDPSYVIGTGDVKSLGAPGHFGNGNLFVAEADEYASDIHTDRTPKLFYQHPDYAIINNIDFDHPDFYDSIDEIESVFATFVKHVAAQGVVIINGDDERLSQITSTVGKDHVVTYGQNDGNEFKLSHFVQKDTESEFVVMNNGKELGTFRLRVPGIHNALNSLSVIAVGMKLGLSLAELQKGLYAFQGSKRRSEVIGKTNNGAIIIDDYAHHPQEIKTTLESLSLAHAHKRIVCIFQPHTYSRTESLLHEFAKGLKYADMVILMPVFASAREEGSDDTVSQKLFEAIKNTGTEAHFLKNPQDVVQYLAQNYDSPKYVIVTMGAGDVYKVGEELMANS